MASTLILDGFADIETEAWDRFVLGAVRYSDGERLCTRNRDEFWSRVLEKGGQVWTWNGGFYDSLDFVDWAIDKDIRLTISLSGSRMTKVQTEGLVLRDAKALVPMSFDKAVTLVGRKKTATGLDCTCPNQCGGYCSIRRDMPPAHYSRLESYLWDDVDGGYEVIEWVLNWGDKHGIELAGTVGMSAWKTAAKELQLGEANWPLLSQYRFARRGYFGGRVQVGAPYSPSGYRYDINSAYPAALANISLPYGEFIIADPEKAKKCYLTGLEGIYECSVYIERDSHLPPLPIHLPDSRVAYPIGTFRGHWTGVELRASESRGARIGRFGRALVWPESGPLIAPFVKRIWDLRAKAGKETAEGTFCKWLANSLTGKFAQAPESCHAVVNPSPEEVKTCTQTGRCSEGCYGACGRWILVDLLSRRVWKAPSFRLDDCAYVHWSAYLTAATRVEWLEQALSDGQEGRTFVYGDTDSIFASTERARNLGDGLGQWSYEGPYSHFSALAPKAYSCAEKTRVKGVPGATSETFRRLAARETVTDTRGVRAFLSASRRTPGEALFRRKTISRTDRSDRLHYGDRILGKDGLTHPQELRNLLNHGTQKTPRRNKS